MLKKNYKILEKNYHSPFGEIDIIAKDDDYIVFIEVKARKTGSIASPCCFVTASKKAKIIKTAMIFLTKFNSDLQPRFDIIEVINSYDKSYIRHIKSAFDVENEYEIF
ncbi:MAG: YraN family protein [Clostridia bacterium]|nr:YraN family protein [Clostridia bacterium]